MCLEMFADFVLYCIGFAENNVTSAQGDLQSTCLIGASNTIAIQLESLSEHYCTEE